VTQINKKPEMHKIKLQATEKLPVVTFSCFGRNIRGLLTQYSSLNSCTKEKLHNTA